MTRRWLRAGLVCIVLLGAACGSSDDGRYSDEFRRAFTDACTSDQSVSFCSCYLDALEARYPEDQVYAVVITGSEAPPPAFIEAAFECVAELDA